MQKKNKLIEVEYALLDFNDVNHINKKKKHN